MTVIGLDGEPTREELEAAHCWERDDRVPGRPTMTAFRQRLRLHQARWREAKGHPIGTQPIAPRPGARTATRLVGSRLPLGYAIDTAAAFVTPGARAAARARASTVEPHQTFDHQRWWADLLWSPSLAVNLFGALWADLGLADRAVHALAPDAPGSVTATRFEHSPGRWDRSFLAGLRTFDAVFETDDGGVVAIGVTYHERAKREIPRPENLDRYREVLTQSRAFTRAAWSRLGEPARGTELTTMWLEHLLLHSMLQHPSRRWRWGRYVLVRAAGNVDQADLCARYCEHLVDDETFTTATLEDLLASGALPRTTARAVRDRYLP